MARGNYAKHARKIRYRASFELDYLLQKCGNKCHWCDCEMVRFKNVRDRLVSKGAHQLTYRDEDGRIRTARIATIDHVRNIRDGGGNRANIVAACAKCNQLRNSAEQKGLPFVPSGVMQS